MSVNCKIAHQWPGTLLDTHTKTHSYVNTCQNASMSVSFNSMRLTQCIVHYMLLCVRGVHSMRFEMGHSNPLKLLVLSYSSLKQCGDPIV